MADAAILQSIAPAAPRRRHDGGRWVAAALLLLFAAMPLWAAWRGEPFYLTLFSRVMVYAIAATSLNLVLGYGGMVSFGHSVYLGIGAYAVGILSFHGVHSGVVHVAAALAVALTAAAAIGILSLRTSGIAFIMITLAFAQMVLFFCIGLREYGGDDGMPLSQRSAFGWLDLEDPVRFYYAVFAVLLAALYGLSRLVSSRFGMALRGSKINERRMVALGFPTLRYLWVAYMLSALVCTLAGVLLANLTRYVSPALIQWSVSGELIVMVVLGGLGTVMGPVIGALAVVLFEELVSHAHLGLPGGADAFLNDHWMGAFGVFVLLVALYMRRGVYGALVRRSGGDA